MLASWRRPPEQADELCNLVLSSWLAWTMPCSKALTQGSPSIQAHSAVQQVLPDGSLGEPLEGAIQIAASCSLAEGLPSIARFLSDAIKGHLPGTPRPLQVRHLLNLQRTARRKKAVSAELSLKSVGSVVRTCHTA